MAVVFGLDGALLPRKIVLGLRSLFILRLRDFLKCGHVDILVAQLIFNNLHIPVIKAVERFWELPNLLFNKFFENVNIFARTATTCIFRREIFRFFQFLAKFQNFSI